MLEADLQRSIIDWLLYKKIFHYRQNTGAFKTPRGGFVRYGTPGAPDIVVVPHFGKYRGKYVGIEVKLPKGKQSTAQRDFETRLNEAGGAYLLARSLDMVIDFFEVSKKVV